MLYSYKKESPNHGNFVVVELRRVKSHSLGPRPHAGLRSAFCAQILTQTPKIYIRSYSPFWKPEVCSFR